MFQGTVFGLSESGSQPATLTPTSGGLQVAPATGQFPFIVPFTSIEISIGGYDDKQLIFRAKHQSWDLTIYVQDRSILEKFEAFGVPMDFKQKLDRAKRARGSKSRRRYVLAFVIIVGLVGVGFGVWFGFGALSDWVVTQIPVETEVSLGRQGTKEILSKTQVCSHPLLNKAINEIGHRLVKASGQKKYKFYFKITNQSQVNAYALPGGYVFVNLGLIKKAENAEEVAGVLAHEIQHALQRHGLRNVVRKMGLYIMVSLIIGMSDAGMIAIAGGLAELGSLSFSRTQETDADVKGLDLLYKAGIDPKGLPTFFERLNKLEKERGSMPTILSTHPASADRASKLRAMIKKRGKVKLVPLTTNWSEVRKSECRPISFVSPDKDPLPGLNQPGTQNPPNPGGRQPGLQNPPNPGGPQPGRNQPAPSPNNGSGSGGGSG